ncbi:MAG: hypothetical protein ACREH5_06205 [Candidatus Omnitrophota bacterium]
MEVEVNPKALISVRGLIIEMDSIIRNAKDIRAYESYNGNNLSYLLAGKILDAAIEIKNRCQFSIESMRSAAQAAAHAPQ